MYTKISCLNLNTLIGGQSNERRKQHEEDAVVRCSRCVPWLASVRSNDADNHGNMDWDFNRQLGSRVGELNSDLSGLQPIRRQLHGSRYHRHWDRRGGNCLWKDRFDLESVAITCRRSERVQRSNPRTRLLHTGSPISFCRDHHHGWGRHVRSLARQSAAVRRSILFPCNPNKELGQSTTTPPAFIAVGF